MEVEGTSTTSTTMVPRVVGEPLDAWIVVSAGLAVLVVILVVGVVVTRRMRAGTSPEK